MVVKKHCILIFSFLLSLAGNCVLGQGVSGMLIAHRGGVVDSSYTENGMPALKKALERGYSMIEIDVRVTRDGVLIANHDADFKRFYGFDKKVVDADWDEIKKLKSNLDGNSPCRLEDILVFCRENKLGVMLDNKITGLDTELFNRLLEMLDEHKLRRSALMIGTEESTAFFTGKVRLSCSRKQLEENMLKASFKPEHYFLFERPANLSREDVVWAEEHHLMIVAAINKFHYRGSPDFMADAGKDCHKIKTLGVRNFQIDSEFQVFLK
jgi:glycerophosphoryl diester phosphodiesterase